MLEAVECVLSPQCAEGAFEVVDQRSRRISVRAISANAGSEGNVMVDRRVLLAGVGEVGLLGVPVVSADVIRLLAELEGYDFVHSSCVVCKASLDGTEYSQIAGCLEDNMLRINRVTYTSTSYEITA